MCNMVRLAQMPENIPFLEIADVLRSHERQGIKIVYCDSTFYNLLEGVLLSLYLEKLADYMSTKRSNVMLDKAIRTAMRTTPKMRDDS